MKFFSKQKKDKVNLNEKIEVKEPRDLSLVLDRMGVGFLVLDNKDCISEVNQSGIDFLEIPATALGSPVVEILRAHELVQLFRKVKEESS